MEADGNRPDQNEGREEVIVTTRHLFTIPWFSRRKGFCRYGARTFFRRHGLDWRSFLRSGIEARELEATGDGLALALVEWARKCEREAVRGQEQ